MEVGSILQPNWWSSNKLFWSPFWYFLHPSVGSPFPVPGLPLPPAPPCLIDNAKFFKSPWRSYTQKQLGFIEENMVWSLFLPLTIGMLLNHSVAQFPHVCNGVWIWTLCLCGDGKIIVWKESDSCSSAAWPSWQRWSGLEVMCWHWAWPLRSGWSASSTPSFDVWEK